MRKLLLILAFLFSFGAIKAQYESDSCEFYEDMYVDSAKVYKNYYTADFIYRNDSSLLYIQSHLKRILSTELLALNVTKISFDTVGCQYTIYNSVELRLNQPELIAVKQCDGNFVRVGISDGKSLTIWNLRRKDKELRP